MVQLGTAASGKAGSAQLDMWENVATIEFENCIFIYSILVMTWLLDFALNLLKCRPDYRRQCRRGHSAEESPEEANQADEDVGELIGSRAADRAHRLRQVTLPVLY